MTALGPITVRRVYFTCPACALGGHPADAPLGIDGRLTTHATRLICLAGGPRSFAHAEMLLRELCGWRVSDERIRQACHAEADRVAAWRAGPPAPTPAAAPAPPTEFQVDATKVNTDTGWRDMKIGVFARRERGRPPPPTAGRNGTCPGRPRGWRSPPSRRSARSPCGGGRGRGDSG